MQLPEEFIQYATEALGQERAAVLFREIENGTEQASIRVNPFKGNADVEGLEKVPWSSLGYYLPQRPVFTLDPLFHAGGYYVQEASSMYMELAMAAIEKDFAGRYGGEELSGKGFFDHDIAALDLCAAPGGKTLLAAEKAAKVLSRDVSEYKTSYIYENCTRLGLEDKVEVQVWDATVRDESKTEWADVVIMDVPCSGLGVLGKKRDIKYNVTPESLESLALLQRQIVENSWQYVKKGGTLLYSTCTIHRAENQEMSRWMCENFPFELEEEKQFLPGLSAGDGFYYAKLRRKA